MLIGISPLISPELLKVLAEMGHGEEIVFADAHFPAYTYNTKVLRLDGVKIPDLLTGVLPLFMLDSYDPSPLMMMAAVEIPLMRMCKTNT
ncbi:RbsD/FucU family protein [Formosa algae]|uniref:L-fucose mutarotase/ribose pyranase (RbsD/FucU family) n=1 Tax=Formosa algae TaxID=225843 RepID=A0A9X0YKV3_9FLAO|nr:RbsD/FucU domain-containing protein [Formosa algae]MBP1840415.1 L-fucose mutarotase/ribose pyranase (RbsD/FucU family) [Formosa algae]MDQ0336907.1 L-fucose mutarotase/ribose pyranase (RbsD/FucU family) [Formosa algae]